ncbi:putative Zn-dependent protease [Lysinibacillus composti]|uniref:Tetratricopeptide repeat protein n=1 Tax=Lysinibacillus composti TaxID=720633 RepID=A0A3N9UJC5_9BACI|nr:tetratricopeptide repeat protein [Lysinibacillus composti]MBM7609061.1 putative Zn-dependent protease [Lysinibacillus composti]RQW75518.1 tetratricopeptide repeat protein [Lysinibacillus composti]
MGIVAFIVLGVIVANVMASKQDKQFSMEDTLYKQATELHSQGNNTEAATYIKELLKLQSESEAVNYLGAVIAASNNEMQQAATLLQKTLDINPYKVEDPMFMLQFGETLYHIERYDDAKIVLTRCQEAGWAPESFPTYQERVAELLSLIENM